VHLYLRVLAAVVTPVGDVRAYLADERAWSHVAACSVGAAYTKVQCKSGADQLMMVTGERNCQASMKLTAVSRPSCMSSGGNFVLKEIIKQDEVAYQPWRAACMRRTWCCRTFTLPLT
jgi:uncharacterized protein GlcG (DUF336 family)